MKKPLRIEVVFSVKFALWASEIPLRGVKLLRSEIFADANVGKFNFTFCDSRKYHNPEGIISHFALAKYFTDHFYTTHLGGLFLAFLVLCTKNL